MEQLESRWAPAVLTVNNVGDTTSANSFLTLREAVEIVDGTLGRALTAVERAQISGALGTNDTIQFNLPAGSQTITLTGGALSLTNPVTINGPGAGNLTINGNNLDRDIIVGTNWSPNPGLNVSINGLTLAGGSQAYGGGLLNFGTLTVSNTTFADNTAGSSGGGGIYNVTVLTLNNCTFTGNAILSVGAGAAIDNISSATATINNCTFTGNNANGSGSSAGSGGAIANYNTMTVTDSTFTANMATSDGGAIYSTGSLTVSNTSFINNSGLADGGAIRSDGTLALSSSTFAGNSAASAGGGLDTTDTVVTVTNCTFVNNTAVSQGGGIEADPGSGTATLTNDTFTGNRVTVGSSGAFGGGLMSGRPVTLFNTIVAGNFAEAAPGTTADDVEGTVTSTSAFNLIGTGGSGGLTNGSNGNQVGVSNPGLGTLSSNGGPTQTVLPLPGSPAIGHGGNAYVTAGETDQRGLTRVVNGTVDIGAVEVQTSLTGAGIQSAAAGTATSFTLGSFADADSTAGPWSVDVNWGDGSADTTFTTSSQGSLGTQKHTYPSGGTATVTVRVTDANNDASTATFSVTVSGTVSHAVTTFTVTGFPSPIIAGTAGSFTVTARDAFQNVVTGYTGTVYFTSTDPLAVLPPDYTFTSSDNGVQTFSAVFNSAGTQSLTVKDTGATGAIGTETGITVNARAVLTVNSTADTTSAGNVLTLREAIDLVDGTLGRSLTAAEQAQVTGNLANNPVIQFNLPTGSQTITLTGGALDITSPVTINGPGAGALTINGSNQDRVFVIGTIFTQNLGLAVSIGGLTIADGNQGYGGGLLNFGTLTVSNTTFANNTAASSGGGGLYNDGVLNLSNSTFTANTVTSGGAGGGLENNGSGTATVSNCTFTGNNAPVTGPSAGSGAGIGNSGTMTLSNSTFTGNTAASDGGAIYNDGALTVSTTTFANNTALSDGGGIRSSGTSLTLNSSTFNGNYAAGAGGGIEISDAQAAITNCTFVNNSSISQGGGIEAESAGGPVIITNTTITGNRSIDGSLERLGGGLYNDRATTLFNTIVIGNFQGAAPSTTPNDVSGYVNSGSAYNLIGTIGSGLVNGVDGNQIGLVSPLLGALANNGGPTQTVALLPGSPAIGAGSTAYVTPGETDQRGLPRVVNGSVDLGAFQTQTTQVQTGQITSTAPANQSATAGTAASFNLGSFADTYSAASPWSVDVNWGDGSPDTTFTTSTQGTLRRRATRTQQPARILSQ